MRILKATISLIALAFTSSLLLAAQPNWIAVTPDNNAWLDTASVKRVEGKLLIWFIHNTANAETYPYARPGLIYGSSVYKSTATLYSIDCKTGKWATLQTGYYSEQKLTGEYLGGTTTPDNAVSFSYPIPGSIGSSDVDVACSIFSSKK